MITMEDIQVNLKDEDLALTLIQNFYIASFIC